MQSFCRVLGELPETLQKLCYSTKFSRQKTLRNLSILLSEYSSSFLSLSRYIWLSLSRKLITDFNLSVFTYHDCHYFLDTLFRQVFCNIPKCKVVTPNVNVTPKCFDKQLFQKSMHASKNSKGNICDKDQYNKKFKCTAFLFLGCIVDTFLVISGKLFRRTVTF